MFDRTPLTFLPVSAALLLFANACLAAPVIYRIGGEISLSVSVGSGIDSAGLDGAAFVAEFIVDSETPPSSTFSSATSERATYPAAAASIRFFKRPSSPDVTLGFVGEVQAMNFFASTPFTDRLNMQPLDPWILGEIEGRQIMWGPEQTVVFPLDFFPGTNLPPVPVFSENDVVSLTVSGFVHDENNDGFIEPLTGDTLYEVSNAWASASLGASCEIQLSQGTYPDGDTVTAAIFRLANPGTEAVAVELKSWLERPASEPLSLVNVGADGSLVLPPGLDANLGPIPLMTVRPAMPRGRYAWDCRLIDPVTGESRSTDINFFDIE